MWSGPDANIVKGTTTRYSCQTVADVDKHLVAITGWLAKILPTMTPDRQARIQAVYRTDLDALLDARIMLASLDSLDADLDAWSGPEGSTPPGRCPTAQHEPHSSGATLSLRPPPSSRARRHAGGALVVVGVLILALAMAYVVLVLREPRPPR
jgi:hypothetical protein